MIRPEYYGKYGELEAARYLQKQGYKLYDVNYRCRFGEIDLICTKGQYLVFVEVKTRSQGAIADPAEFVDQYKQARIIQTAKLFLAQNPTKKQPRFDVIEVFLQMDGTKSIKHLENAFALV